MRRGSTAKRPTSWSRQASWSSSSAPASRASSAHWRECASSVTGSPPYRRAAYPAKSSSRRSLMVPAGLSMSRLARAPGLHHLLPPHAASELLRGDVAEGQRGLAKGGPVFMRPLCDLRRAVIADVGRQRGDQHEGVAHVVGDAVHARNDPLRAVLAE